jgi:hypothetical protein
MAIVSQTPEARKDGAANAETGSPADQEHDEQLVFDRFG